MFNVDNYVNNIIEVVTGFKFLLVVFVLALCFKVVILVQLILNRKHAKGSQKQLALLLVTVFSAILINTTWVIKTANNIFFGALDEKIIMCFTRITWAILTLHYHSLALFVESLVKHKKLFKNMRQKIFLPISAAIFFFFVVTAVVNFNNPIKSSIEHIVTKAAPVYYLFWILLVSLVVSLLTLRSSDIPRILKRQFHIFIKVLFVPIAISEFIHFYPIKHLYVGKKYTITAISIALITYALYRCIKKIMGLRFLNLKERVQSKKELYFVYNFKNILDKFSNITNTRELVHITKTFFKETLAIPIQKTHLYTRKLKQEYETHDTVILTQDESTVEAFLSTQDETGDVKKFLRKEKIVIHDELAFSNFYQEEKTREKILAFLNHLNADIFIPIYESHKMVAYIIVERFSRLSSDNKNNEFYSKQEGNQIIVFSNYLGKIINLLQTKNLNHIIKQEKDLSDKLHIKEQEVNQYKESIRSFLINNKEKKIGIIFYKNRLFTPVNQTAQSLIPINLNTHWGHPTSKAIKKIANQVIEYKSPQTCFIKNNIGEKLVISGIPNIEKNNVIITVRYPEISDILADKSSMLKDPTLWEYLLYLETTEYGSIIHNFIPSNCETFLNFKIDLLRAALNKKAVIISAEEDDVMSIVEILHHISSREIMEVIDAKKSSKQINIQATLFGTNPIFGTHNAQIPFFKKLDKTGTLYIKNIDFLDLETQNHIEQYIKCGIYKNLKSNNKEKSNVRLIFSASTNLKNMAQEGKFLGSLYNQLTKNQVIMPKICNLPDQEIFDIANNIVKKAIKTDEFHHILELEKNDKKRIIKSCPASINELKKKVHHILIKKSQKQSIYNETTFDPTYNITDPEIIEAARLGKHALRDPKIMAMLWNKFKNQNKISNLLGVNRSSVNRRCKEYNLI
ncbi:sigma 54-interacting transcriptional regulator [Candidatus Dependentiae bacterium]